MAVLSRDALLAAKPPFTLVPVPHLGGEVRVQGISILNRNKLVDAYLTNIEAVKAYEEDQAKPEGERQNLTKVTLHDQIALTMVFAIADEDGDPMFTIDDLALFESMDHLTLKRLYDAFNALNDAPTADQIDAKKKPSVRTRRR